MRGESQAFLCVISGTPACVSMPYRQLRERGRAVVHTLFRANAQRLVSASQRRRVDFSDNAQEGGAMVLSSGW